MYRTWDLVKTGHPIPNPDGWVIALTRSCAGGDNFVYSQRDTPAVNEQVTTLLLLSTLHQVWSIDYT